MQKLVSPNAVFYNLETESVAGPELIFTQEHANSYVEPAELTAIAMDASNPVWADRIASIRRNPQS